ncbi:TPA: ribonuclease Y [Patescibacteria group bacterium]|nr:ribonuclease Y [Patescibacteria group bacterium]
MELNILVLGGIIFGLIAGYFIRQAISVRKANSLEQKIKSQVEEAQTQAREIVLKAQDKAASLYDELKKEESERGTKLDRLEGHLIKKEELLNKQTQDVEVKQKKASEELVKINSSKADVEDLRKQATEKLEKLSDMGVKEAKESLLEMVKKDHQKDLVDSIRKLEKERREEVEKKSLDIITTALQRYARSHIAEMTTTTFTLPDEDLKGKIIGREGRNIRALERLTGVEIIVDETPETIVISSFNPMRREIARLALDKLIKDGRIQPAKIEEKVDEAQRETDKRVMELGEDAVYELGVVDFPKEIIKLLGQLHFRTSYGQNVLHHSIEMAHIAGMIASELGANVEVAKKAALVHDIGKAIDHEVEGTHIELGRKLLKKYGVDELVIRAMEAHHDDYPHTTPEAFIVTTADVLSGARPGARRDSVENYVKRLDGLEKIALDFEGVKSAFAVSGGREIRVFVIPEKIDDFSALQLAKDISNRIQSEMKYPGEVKINVIREMRAIEYAR